MALVLSVVGGFAIGAMIHSFPRLRRAIDPFLASYYALPFFAFYPLFIVLFGLGRGRHRGDRLRCSAWSP